MATTGNIAVNTEPKTLMDTIVNCRNKWGKGYTETYYPTKGEGFSAAKVNKYNLWLRDVKNRTRPGNSISVPGDIGAGSLITASWLNDLQNAATKIYNHCHSNCHSNCYSDCNCESCGTGTN